MLGVKAPNYSAKSESKRNKGTEFPKNNEEISAIVEFQLRNHIKNEIGDISVIHRS